MTSKFLKDNDIQVNWDYDSMVDELLLYSFAMSKVVQADVLQSIRETLKQAIQGKLSKQQAKDLISNRLKTAGLWGRVEVNGKPSLIGTPWRVESIYRTNVQSAFMQGRWRHFQSTKDDRPYLQYKTQNDDRVRPEHSILHNKVWHIDNKVWNKIYPPSSWNCRCFVISLTKKQAKARGINSSRLNLPPTFFSKGFDNNVGNRNFGLFNSFDKRLDKMPVSHARKFVSEIVSSAFMANYLLSAMYDNDRESSLYMGNIPVDKSRAIGLNGTALAIEKSKLVKSGLSPKQISKLPVKLLNSKEIHKKDGLLFIGVRPSILSSMIYLVIEIIEEGENDIIDFVGKLPKGAEKL